MKNRNDSPAPEGCTRRLVVAAAESDEAVLAANGWHKEMSGSGEVWRGPFPFPCTREYALSLIAGNLKTVGDTN